jgi:spoIIIJ-associated protein
MPGRFPDAPDGDRPSRRDDPDQSRPGVEPPAEPEGWTPEEDLGEPEIAEAVADTLEEAIGNALEILGAREDEVEIEVLETGHRGFLGMGKRRPFRVRVTWIDDQDEETIEEEVGEDEQDGEVFVEPEAPPPPAPPVRSAPVRSAPPRPAPVAPPAPARAQAPVPTPLHRSVEAAAGDLPALAARAQEVTEELLRRMGMEASVRVSTTEDEILLSVESDVDDALLIGRRGETRAALEHLVHRLAVPRDAREVLVHLDVNGYWERRIERLRAEALDLAAEAVRDRQEIRTEPLSAQERRVVHRALADDDRVTTESLGAGALKRVAIIPTTGR